jgi:hypothetical protein
MCDQFSDRFHVAVIVHMAPVSVGLRSIDSIYWRRVSVSREPNVQNIRGWVFSDEPCTICYREGGALPISYRPYVCVCDPDTSSKPGGSWRWFRSSSVVAFLHLRR